MDFKNTWRVFNCWFYIFVFVIKFLNFFRKFYLNVLFCFRAGDIRSHESFQLFTFTERT